MRKLLLILIMCLISTLQLLSEHITLTNGKQLYGTILHQTEDLIVFQTTGGQRYQLLKKDVLSIDTEEEKGKNSEEKLNPESSRPIAIRIAVSGGVSAIRDEKAGGTASVDLQLGSRRIADYPIFLAGSVGYMGSFAATTAHFVPLQIALSLPLHLIKGTTNGAEMGCSLGYGFGLRNTKGGITGGINLGYRHYVSSQTSVIISATAQFQQTQRAKQETINTQTYTNTLGGTIWLIGAKLSMQF